MRDFTLKKYKAYLTSIINTGLPFYRYDEFLENHYSENDTFCLIRHDVDRKPNQSLAMAKLENSMGIRSTYYFRMKNCSFDKKIIKEIEGLGHEIGYHYEVLSDTEGDFDKALDLFKVKLKELREVSTVKTCSMHGRPLKPYDNRDLWRKEENHLILKNELGLLGEVYLDINYSDIVYINDTGRNWTSGKSNIRDKVYSNIPADFSSTDELMSYLENSPHSKIVFQIHPERWSDNYLTWCTQFLKDTVINILKKILN